MIFYFFHNVKIQKNGRQSCFGTFLTWKIETLFFLHWNNLYIFIFLKVSSKRIDKNLNLWFFCHKTPFLIHWLICIIFYTSYILQRRWKDWDEAFKPCVTNNCLLPVKYARRPQWNFTSLLFNVRVRIDRIGKIVSTVRHPCLELILTIQLRQLCD